MECPFQVLYIHIVHGYRICVSIFRRALQEVEAWRSGTLSLLLSISLSFGRCRLRDKVIVICAVYSLSLQQQQEETSRWQKRRE